MPTLIPDPLVQDVARDLVRQLAPRELPLFAATSRAYFQEPDRVTRRDAGDRTLGFGAEFAVFVTPVALLVVRETLGLLADIFKDSLRTEGTTAAGEALRRLFRGGEDKGEPAAAPIALSRDELRLVREHALKTARGLVPPDQAERLADALTSSLATV